MGYGIQKASMWKRFSAALTDFVFLAVVALGVALLFSWALDYDAKAERFGQIEESYKDAYSVNISQAEYDALSENEKTAFDARYDEANKKFGEDPEANRLYRQIIYSTLLIVTSGILISVLLLEFAVPLLFKNGSTVGKKIFGIAVVREDSVRISPLLLFIRAVLGKYTIELMMPIMVLLMMLFGILHGLVGMIVLGGLAILQIVVIAMNPNRTPLHDLLAHTAVVDFASQRIFESSEELLEYQKTVHAEAAENAEYH